jgi:hypothetical protein
VDQLDGSDVHRLNAPSHATGNIPRTVTILRPGDACSRSYCQKCCFSRAECALRSLANALQVNPISGTNCGRIGGLLELRLSLPVGVRLVGIVWSSVAGEERWFCSREAVLSAIGAAKVRHEAASQSLRE